MGAQPSSVAGMTVVGQLVGRYKVKHYLDKGSFGKVWCAVQADTGEAVALKLVVACGSILITT